MAGIPEQRCEANANAEAQGAAPAAPGADEARFMRRAIELAWRGWGWTNPNPLVGCVLVRDGRIIFDLTDEAVNRLAISDTELTFQARFGENNEIFDVLVPLNRIIAVTPLECQQFALHFEVTETPVEEPEEAPAQPAPGVRRPMRVK